MKISIIMTVYNREKYLADAIESVINSSFSDWQLIIWDDGSIDNSVNIAKKYAVQNKKITIAIANHQGRAIALHNAIALSTGDYIGILDSDDILHKDAMTFTSKYLDSHRYTGMVYTQCFVIDSSSLILNIDNRSKTPYSLDNLLVSMMTFHFRLFRKKM